MKIIGSIGKKRTKLVARLVALPKPKHVLFRLDGSEV